MSTPSAATLAARQGRNPLHRFVPFAYFCVRRSGQNARSTCGAGDWVRFFERHGYEVETITVISSTPDLIQTESLQLAPAYRSAPAADLNSLVTHFVARRRDRAGSDDAAAGRPPV